MCFRSATTWCRLRKRAGDDRLALRAKHRKELRTRGEKEEEVRQEVMEKTTKGTKGWASGPYTEHEVTTVLGRAWVSSGPGSVKAENRCLLTTTLRALSTVPSSGDGRWSRPCCWQFLEWKTVKVALLTGEVIRGVRHAAHDRPTRLVGKCYDLEAAYKQCSFADRRGSRGLCGPTPLVRFACVFMSFCPLMRAGFV